jgi:hypothetical protein
LRLASLAFQVFVVLNGVRGGIGAVGLAAHDIGRGNWRHSEQKPRNTCLEEEERVYFLEVLVIFDNLKASATPIPT